jgi:hypothetical protein
MDVTGSVKLTRTAAGLSFNSNANNQQWAFGGYTETRNGTRDISATANSANVNSSMTIVYAGSSFNGQMVNALTANFSPASGSSIQADKPLPSGQFTYSGTVDFTLTDGDGGAFTVTTITPLAYNSACTNSDANLFDSGEVHVHYQPDDASASYAKVVWSNCGAPTVTYVAETPVAPTK